MVTTIAVTYFITRFYPTIVTKIKLIRARLEFKKLDDELVLSLYERCMVLEDKVFELEEIVTQRQKNIQQHIRKEIDIKLKEILNDN
jgi:hypothetical protein